MTATLAEKTEPTRKLRLLGDGTHAEQQVAGSLAVHDVEQEMYDLVKSYRRTYLTSVYSEPEAGQEEASRVAPACPCYSTL